VLVSPLYYKPSVIVMVWSLRKACSSTTVWPLHDIANTNMIVSRCRGISPPSGIPSSGLFLLAADYVVIQLSQRSASPRARLRSLTILADGLLYVNTKIICWMKETGGSGGNHTSRSIDCKIPKGAMKEVSGAKNSIQLCTIP